MMSDSRANLRSAVSGNRGRVERGRQPDNYLLKTLVQVLEKCEVTDDKEESEDDEEELALMHF